MKKYLNSLLALMLTTIVVTTSSCSSETGGKGKDNSSDLTLTWNDLFDMNSDAVLNKEQQALKQKIIKTLVSGVRIKDEHFELTINKNDFTKAGIPQIFYDKVVENIAAINFFLDSHSDEFRAECLKQFAKQFEIARQKLGITTQ